MHCRHKNLAAVKQTVMLCCTMCDFKPFVRLFEEANGCGKAKIRLSYLLCSKLCQLVVSEADMALSELTDRFATNFSRLNPALCTHCSLFNDNCTAGRQIRPS